MRFPRVAFRPQLSSARAYASASDPLPGICGVLALCIYTLRGFEGTLDRDMGVYAYAGQQVAEGVPPYLGILNRAGPLAHLAPGVGVAAARAVGADDVLGIRVLFMLLSAGCVAVVYVLGRELFRSRLAGIGAAGTLLASDGFALYASNGPREKTLMVLFLMAALLAVVHQRWATTGALISLAALTWQPAFLVAITGAVVAAALGAERRVLAVGWIVVGGAVPAFLVLFAYVLIGATRELLDAFLLINARYNSSIGFFEHSESRWPDLVDGYGPFLVVLLLGMAVLLLHGCLALRGSSRENRRHGAAISGSAAALVVGLVWTAVQYNRWPDTFVLLPFAALGIGGLFATLTHPRVPVRAALATTSAWVLAVASLAASQAVEGRSHALNHEQAGVRAVLQNLPPDAQLLAVNAPQPLVLAKRRHPIRLQLYGNGLIDYVDDTWPGGRGGLARWFRNRSPEVIAVGQQPPRWLRSGVGRDYVTVGRTGNWRWWVHRTVGAAVLIELKDRLRALGTHPRG